MQSNQQISSKSSIGINDFEIAIRNLVIVHTSLESLKSANEDRVAQVTNRQEKIAKSTKNQKRRKSKDEEGAARAVLAQAQAALQVLAVLITIRKRRNEDIAKERDRLLQVTAAAHQINLTLLPKFMLDIFTTIC
jgi:hypothetical protein